MLSKVSHLSKTFLFNRMKLVDCMDNLICTCGVSHLNIVYEISLMIQNPALVNI
jgi:hypothetical protein